MVSVLTGLLLDVAIALQFGAGEATDAFFVAARLPVGVAMVLFSGANLALVPVFATWLVRRSADLVWSSLTAFLAMVLTATSGVAVVTAVAAPLLVAGLAPGLDPATSALAVTLLRVLVIVVPLTAMAEVLRAVANARESFALPAAMNVVLNVVAAGLILALGHRGITVAAWAYVGGAAARLVLMVPLCWGLGVRLRWRRGPGAGLRDAEARAALVRSIRPGASAGLSPAVRLVEQIFASFLPAGSITLLNYGYRLVFAVGGTVFFRSVIGVLMPRLTRATATGDVDTVQRTTASGVRVMAVMGTTLTVLLTTLAVPACLLVFDRGSFERDDAMLLGALMAALSACLVGEGLQRALLAPFFAGLDTRTPMRNALLAAAVNVLLLPVFVLPFSGGTGALFGIAAAFVVSEYVGAVHAWLRLRRAAGGTPWQLARVLLTLTPSAAIAALVALGMRSLLDLDGVRPVLPGLALVAGTAVVSVLPILAGVLVARLPEAEALTRQLVRRRER
jgi:putative peptidoglycan lipid II flippase